MSNAIRNACRHIVRRRARAALTAGGIFMGVLMVALVCVISSAGTQTVTGELRQMGLQGISVSASAGLTADELQVIREVEGVSEAMPLMTLGGPATLCHHDFTAYIGGIDAGADQVIALEVAHGRMFTAGDISAAAQVCVVDEAVAKAAYQRTNVIGKTLTVTVGETALDLTIVGVARAGSSLLQSVSGYLSGLVYVPYTTLQATGAKQVFSQVAVQVSEENATESVRQRLVTALERSAGQSGGYTVSDLAVQRQRLSRIMDIVVLILTAVSGVSLIVAGTGILTSMLTAVNERVREIGIKQALGATRRHILMEFLWESVLLGAVGGALGIAFGAAVGAAGTALVGLPISLPWGRFALLWLGTMLLGGVFGWYPAKKAAALSPAEALRAGAD